LYMNNDFLMKSKDESQNVIVGKIVHIPQAGAASGVKKNRSVFPAPVTRRSDTDIVYALEEFSSNPITIPNIDTIQLSYDKRQSVMFEDQAQLAQNVANEMLNKWAGLPADNNIIMRTSGAGRAAISPSGTGLRKAFTLKDLLAVRAAFAKQNLPAGGIWGVLTPDMINDIVNDPAFAANSVWMSTWLSTGKFPAIAGFAGFYERTSTPLYNSGASSIRTYDDDGNLVGATATDCASASFWHEACVERAMGEVKFFGREADPQYYGDIYSFLAMAGGRKRRADGKGVIQLVETPTV
jgi:hypothetical protein